MVYSALSLIWFLLYLCASVFAAPIAPVIDAVSLPSKRGDSVPPSAYYTPTTPISRRYLSSRPARSANDAQVQNFLRKRELVITMLNGAPVESRFVNLLDLWHMAEKAVERTPPGTPRHTELVDFQETTAFKLTRLMQGVAILQSVVDPGPTPSIEIDEEPVLTIAAESTTSPSSTTESSLPAATTSESSPDTAPSATSTNEPTITATPRSSSPVIEPISTVAEPILTVVPAPVPAPAPQPPSPVPGDGTVAAGNIPEAGDPPAPARPSVSSVVSASSSRANPAEAAQATGSINLAGGASVARLPGMSWVVLGALCVWGAGVF